MAKLSTTLRDYFCRTAAPNLLWSDGGPQFTSHQFADFLQTWGVTHVTSSPHYPQSNGKPESHRKTHEEAHLDSMDRLLCQLGPTFFTCTPPVQEHPLSKTWTVTRTKTIRPPSTGYSSCPPSFLCTRVAEIQSRSRFSHHTYIKNIPGHL